MKNKVPLLSSILLLGLAIDIYPMYAEEISPVIHETEGTILLKTDDESTPPVDPENPDPTNPIDPSDPPDTGTGGPLSIDYSSRFKFGLQQISTLDKIYYASADIMGNNLRKPTYVQVTDKRGTLAGWKLTISQPNQFKTVDGDILEGAELTLTKGEVASSVNSDYTPTVVEDRLSLKPGVGNFLVINAKKNTGVGTWIYRFGSDEKENRDAVQLKIPGTSVKLAKKYSTELVWTLEDTPNN